MADVIPCSQWHVLLVLIAANPPAHTASPTVDPEILDFERARVEQVAALSDSVVAIFPLQGQGGGSGVIISSDGLVLTNFHVTGNAPAFRCGLPDGRLYDAVIVGIDPLGDIALIKLLGRDDFPSATFGDSDRVAVGDPVLAIGNPFLLATDFSPTVTTGIVSGIHRYQPPAGDGNLEYTDCIQTDAAINPGNSGGPLFSQDGTLIGINGRISLEKRGRINVGVAYAISVNQIKNFLDHLRGGLIVEHATIEATVRTADDGRVLVDRVLESSDAFRRGLRQGDELVAFSGRAVASANDFQNILGTLPAGWVTDLTLRRGNQRQTLQLRLTPIDSNSPKQQKPPKRTPKTAIPSAIAPYFQPADGLANDYFNRQFRERLLEAIDNMGDFQKHKGSWRLEFQSDAVPTTCIIHPDSVEWHADGEPVIYRPGESNLDLPSGSGGFLLAIDHWRQFLRSGATWFSKCRYAGSAPDPNGTRNLVLATERAGTRVHWHFHPKTNRLVAAECWANPAADPCVIRWSDFKDENGSSLPQTWEIQHAGQNFATFKLKTMEFAQ